MNDRERRRAFQRCSGAAAASAAAAVAAERDEWHDDDDGDEHRALRRLFSYFGCLAAAGAT